MRYATRAALLHALASLCIGSLAHAAEPLTLSSSAFKDGTMLAKKSAGMNPSNPNCVGENISPPLAWKNPPAGTKSYAILLVDPEGMNGLGVVHWVAYGVPVTVTGFAAGEVSNASDKYVGGTSIMNRPTYFGPCPPPNSGAHHYTFTLIATDLDPMALPAGLSRDDLLAKLKGHALGASSLVALFRHP
jgi:Raf kinase inhibitor-like YbhB/YbcL family protein